jgi:hypothetical protein
MTVLFVWVKWKVSARLKVKCGVLRFAQNDRQKEEAAAQAKRKWLGNGGGGEADFSTALLTMKL